MGSERTTETRTEQTTTPTATPEEQQLNQLQLEQAKEFDPLQRELNRVFGQLGIQLGRGQELPGFLQGLPGGISPEVTSGIVKQSLEDIKPGFQQAGILDSGVAAEISARTAGDIRRTSAEFNIGNLQNLLNLALSGQAQIQQPILQQSSLLGQRLAGLRPISQTGGQFQQTASPFSFGQQVLAPFAQGFGSGLGSAFSPFGKK